jgi:hypothetical protein
MQRWTSYLVVAAAAAGCGTGVDRDPQIGSPAEPQSPTGGPDPGKGSGDTRCAAPDGPRHWYRLAAELDALMIGKWRLCDGTLAVLDTDSRGLEFAADGKYYLLIDGEGGLVRDHGFTGEGEWYTVQPTESETAFLWMWPTPSTALVDAPVFEDDPRRLAFFVAYDRKPAIFLHEP